MYFQTLEEVSWLSRLKKSKNQKPQNLKQASFIKKLLKIVTLKS